MCGIAGRASVRPDDHRSAVRAMRGQLIHRGPDSPGEYVDEHVGLGIRRLRVVDLVTGDQPQCNEDRTVWTVFNGEIYNFRELREELLARGHRLATMSDTEVIVHLYEDLGDRFVERIDGMFALAVWDRARRLLVLARDRLGKKPLLYHEHGGVLSFASEHTALLTGLAARPPVDPRSLRLYLRLGYVPAPHDAFSGIHKLEPGHVLVWRDGATVIRRYWTLPTPGSLQITEEEAVAETRRLLRAAVARRLIADVPIGAFLSGGVDSSGVVALMAEHGPVRTFTIDFADQAFSERDHARRIAERYGTEHHEFTVGPGEVDVLPTLVRHYGEPYADSSAIPTFHLARLTRQHVTVALNGDGGDELFAGYERYFAARLASYGDRIPAPVRGAVVGTLARALPDSISPAASLRRARRFLQAVALGPQDRYLRWVGIFDRRTLRDLLTPSFDEVTRDAEDAETLADRGGWQGDPVAAAQLLDLRLYLPDDLLVKVDIASMANSLEVRSPLLDRELVEFAVALPTSLKIRGAERKYLLKKALEGLVPRENMYRRKQGFGVPIGAWFRQDLRTIVQDTVLSPEGLARGYFRPDRVRRLVDDHVAGRVDHTHRLWALLMLELWHREFVDAAARPSVLGAA